MVLEARRKIRQEASQAQRSVFLATGQVLPVTSEEVQAEIGARASSSGGQQEDRHLPKTCRARA